MRPELAIPLPREAIEAFCKRWGIVELSVFGSVLRDDFRAESDVDVLVTFAADAHVGLMDLVHAQDELGVILGRRVDLVERQSVEESRNWIRRRSILSSARPIYVAAG